MPTYAYKISAVQKKEKVFTNFEIKSKNVFYIKITWEYKNKMSLNKIFFLVYRARG